MKRDRYVSATYKCRVHAGTDALAELPRELDRLKVGRAIIVCGSSVAHKTNLVDRIRGLIGEKCVGTYDGIGRHATVSSVQSAAALARRLEADCIIAVGAGTALMAARIVGILAREARPIEQLVTQYPETGDAISPRLDAAKPVIINILTAATLAQNRAGGALKDPLADHRLEFFDPKTRPSVIFWDAEALMTAPASLALDTCLTIFWFSLMTRAVADPRHLLSFGDRDRAFELAAGALRRIGDGGDVSARIEACAAALLLNRDEDSGNRLADEHWIVRICYALGSGIFMLRDDIGPGITYAVLTAPAIRRYGNRNPEVVEQMGVLLRAVGASLADGSPQEVAREFERFLERGGLPRRLRDLGVDRVDLLQVRINALKNFNADRSRRLLSEVEALDQLLLDAW